MWFKFSQNDKDLIKLLKRAGSDFQFDRNKIKHRLLASINKADQKPIRHFHFDRVVKYSIEFVSLVLITSATLAFASVSQPGDKLFALNKLGEQVILNLPLSVEQKAKVQEYIVTNRLQALDQVVEKKESKKLETIKESDKTLQSAVDQIVNNKKRLEKAGKTEAAEKLEKVLDHLQAKAEKREAKIKKLEDEASDEQVKLKIKNHRLKFKTSREKALKEIKRFQKTD